MRLQFWCAVTIAVSLSASQGFAEVADSGPAGFTVRGRVTLAAPPTAVYAALVQRVAAWWSSDHTWSGDARNLSIDARPQGCFCERLPDGGGVRHMTVVYAAPGTRLRMVGGLGPLQSLAVAATLDVALTPVGEGTALTWSYAVGGYVPGGAAAMAPAVDRVISDQFARFARFLATGNPAPPSR